MNNPRCKLMLLKNHTKQKAFEIADSCSNLAWAPRHQDHFFGQNYFWLMSCCDSKPKQDFSAPGPDQQLELFMHAFHRKCASAPRQDQNVEPKPNCQPQCQVSSQRYLLQQGLTENLLLLHLRTSATCQTCLFKLSEATPIFAWRFCARIVYRFPESTKTSFVNSHV